MIAIWGNKEHLTCAFFLFGSLTAAQNLKKESLLVYPHCYLPMDVSACGLPALRKRGLRHPEEGRRRTEAGEGPAALHRIAEALRGAIEPALSVVYIEPASRR